MRRLMTMLWVLLGVAAIGLSAESSAGVRWTAPTRWKQEAAQPTRAATYTIAPAAGDKATAECGVYFFGPGQGGSIAANIARWKSQFKDAQGTPAPAQVATRTIRKLKMTTIDTEGAYSGLGGPRASGRAVPGYRLLGAIVEAPGGNIFIKFTGPAHTVEANESRFEQLLSSFRADK
jgi:hypothetical protein